MKNIRLIKARTLNILRFLPHFTQEADVTQKRFAAEIEGTLFDTPSRYLFISVLLPSAVPASQLCQTVNGVFKTRIASH